MIDRNVDGRAADPSPDVGAALVSARRAPEPAPAAAGGRPAVCYVVPHYSAADSSHMAHLPRFLEELGGLCDVHAIIQRADATPALRGVRSVRVQRARGVLARGVELVRLALELRRAGCRTFFVRISVSAACVLGLIGRPLGLRVFYWQSGQSHNLVPRWRRSPRRRLAAEAQFALQRLAMRLAYRVVTGPERMVQHYAAHFGVAPARMVVLYNDVDATALRRRADAERAEGRAELRRRLALPESAPMVLFVGRVSPLKGAGHILPLAEALRAQAPDALLVVVGDDAHTPGIRDRTAAAGLTNVHFAGPQPNAALPAYFAAADVFVLPSDSEGFPRVLIEAMACGTPAVAFDVGGVRDIVPAEYADFVVPRGDVRGMAACTATLLRDPALAQRYVAAATSRVGRYSTGAVARMFHERIVCAAARQSVAAGAAT